MTQKFEITFDVDRADCNPCEHQVEPFVENVLRGSVTIISSDHSFCIKPCGILRVSRSLLRLCTFPILYGIEARETVLDLGIDFRAVYEKTYIALEIMILSRGRKNIVLSLPVADALQVLGRFHRDIVLEIFRRCPSLIDEIALLAEIPDAFALSFIARTTRYGSDTA